MNTDNLHSSSTDSDDSVNSSRRYSRLIALPAVIAIAVLVYLTFFSEKSVSHRLEYQTMIDSLETALQAERDTLEYYRDLNRRLNTDPVLMEQVVREQYNMKRENEDVFIVK
ncbi:MAG: hypothetical protein K2M61_04840 [Muribaculaceae bacterium]|nr:hypothetical protein [Muribaculaceae bacterium]